MTDHSNAITDALDDFADAVDVAATDDFYDSLQKQAQINNALNEAKLALYEAVNLQLPLPILKDDEDLVSTPYRVGYNKALDDVLTNLNVSFGISKEGDTDV